MGKTGRKCGELADRHLGEHAIRSAKWKRGRASRPRPSAESVVGGASPRESRDGEVEGEERSPAAVGRAEGDRRAEGGKGIGGGNWHREGGECIYKLEKLFLEREEWW